MSQLGNIFVPSTSVGSAIRETVTLISQSREFADNHPADNFDIVEPSASPILESLRAFGYSTETAVADLVDNSISAGAGSIAIEFHWQGSDSWFSIADDGDGMSEAQLVAAMRLGSRSPVDNRESGDLGRFGLGLKTASFSQARVLTVATRERGEESASIRQWDLDMVRNTNEWRLLRQVASGLETQLLEQLPSHGTVVAWGSLDRMMDKIYGAEDESTLERFLAIVETVANHLELIFHRFLARPKPLRISVNGRQLRPWDPFMREQNSWSSGPESLSLAGTRVVVQPFVLPHRSKLTEREHSDGAGIAGWNASQGFYVYREDRLLVAGSWLGVGGAKDEHTKLARIAVDLSSKLDHLWQVDVRKASIKAPNAILPDLKRIARATKSKAQEVYRFRGKSFAARVSNAFVIGWESIRERGGVTTYRVNRAHPIVEDALTGGLSDRSGVERLIRFIEETVPVTQIGIAVSDSLDSPRAPFGSRTDEVREQLEYMHSRERARGKSSEQALLHLATIEPFIYYPELVQAFGEGAQ